MKNQYVAVITTISEQGLIFQRVINHPDLHTFNVRCDEIIAKHGVEVDVKVLPRQYSLMEINNLRAFAWHGGL